MHNAYLGLGSNLGDRLRNLTLAVRALDHPPHVWLAEVSSVYETKPVGHTSQPDFLNLVLRVTTGHPPHALLLHCLGVENSLGRVRRERWGPRTMDIDMLVYDTFTSADPSLTIPHPRMLERSFVLTPLAEIAPDLVLGGQIVRELAGKLDQGGLVKLGPLLADGQAR